jgi:hypothetical protein
MSQTFYATAHVKQLDSKAIRKDVQEGKYEPWEKVYRDVMDRLGHSKKNNNKDVPSQLPRYEQNIEVVWEGFYRMVEINIIYFEYDNLSI